MTRYACPSPSCPRRDPVAASEPPTCYTCGGKMAAAPVVDMLKRVTPSEIIQEAVRTYEGPPAAVDDMLQPSEVRIDFGIPEPTPEQRATRSLPPITISVTPSPITDLEAFRSSLQDAILRALTTIDRVPYDQPVTYVEPGYRLLAQYGAHPLCDCGTIVDDVLHADAATGHAMCQTCVEARLAAANPEPAP